MSRICFRIATMILFVVGFSSQAWAQAFTEDFDNITLLTGNGWFMQNNSTPAGSTSWFQGTATTATPTPGPFNAYSGAANAYIGANYNNTGSTGTISNWLAMPNRTLRNGDVLTFFTRKPTGTDYPDRLEVRLSTNGASTNVGSGATAVGDFTALLLSVNPTLVAGGYPQTWTQYTITISGLPAPTSGRMAFRYFVTSAGALGTNSDYIGIDNTVYTPYVCPAFTMTPGGALAPAVWGQAYSTPLSQTGALGAPSYAVTAGALPPGLTLGGSGTISGTPTATGTFNFTVTVADASGCSGSQSYSIQVEANVPGAPQNVSVTAGNGQATVNWQVPSHDGGSAISGYTVTAVQDGSKTCTTSGALGCTVSGLTNGSAYSFRVVATNNKGPSAAGISNVVTPTLSTVTGTVPGMSGTGSVTLAGGGASCTLDSSSAFTVPSTAPANRTLPHGAFEFLATGCTGSVTISITYPTPLPEGVQFWKFGPATAGAQTSTWFLWTEAALSPDRRTVTYSITDNGIGDSDIAAGRIRDPLAPALGSDPTSIPVNNPWALAALAAILGWMGLRRQQRGSPG
ncbi:IPTL-CTERM sorting domain-containing protein [Acidovorax sp. A79]|uniref:IPTL-CTERM sorting domain-containing protein n=1 Tax=Acidovorax sp. A79 TaxID=3056107 RepID=UPI0034E874DE